MTSPAAAHAEVDVEVRGRHPLGVEEALEEQLEAQRVEVGDPEEVGDDAAGAGAAAGADRDPVGPGPGDEIPHDEEVVDEARLGDDRKLVVQPLDQRPRERGVGESSGRVVVEAIAALEPGEAELLQVAGPVGLHLRRQRVLRIALAALGEGDREVAHLGDELGVPDRLGDLGEKPGHLLARLQVELGAVEAHPLLVLDLGAGLDAEHRVVRAGVAVVHIVDVIRADDLQLEFLRELEEAGDDLALLGNAVVLDFDEIVLAAEDVDEAGERLPCLRVAVVQEVLRHERGQAAGEADQPLGVLRQGGEIRAGLVVEALEVRVGDELEQVLVPGEVAGDQAQVEDALPLVRPAQPLQARALRQVKFAADERLQALGLGRAVEFDRAVEVAVVGQREGGHAERGGPVHQPVDPAGSIQQAVVAVDVEMDEIFVGGRQGALLPRAVRPLAIANRRGRSDWKKGMGPAPGRNRPGAKFPLTRAPPGGLIHPSIFHPRPPSYVHRTQDPQKRAH